ncbi:hypothetical protein [Deinococcus enclensis]|uniref:DUF1508 domain-containing protein n=1 Tax=Deinococcus enclensis TaxID=1049582 RepID=A0ABT9MJ09_9DEIO|nr:hypothetical protein [Deinococcus enclensis]MDP9766570.1 hypothetical protein [Deinococcus enclensis]
MRFMYVAAQKGSWVNSAEIEHIKVVTAVDNAWKVVCRMSSGETYDISKEFGSESEARVEMNAIIDKFHQTKE